MLVVPDLCASVYHWCVTGASVRCQLIYLMCLVTKKFYVSHLLSTIGSGRVIFSTWKSYMDAVTAAFVEIKTSTFTKRVRLDNLNYVLHNRTMTKGDRVKKLSKVF